MWLLLPFAAFALAVMMHGLILRLPLKIDSVRRFLLIGLPLGLFLVVVSLSVFGFTMAGFAAIVLYALLCELYLFLFTLVISSVSVTMLIMLRRGSIESAALISTYDPNEMVRVRIDNLVKTGFVERHRGKLAMTAKGRMLHRTFSVLRRFFCHDTPGSSKHIDSSKL